MQGGELRAKVLADDPKQPRIPDQAHSRSKNAESDRQDPGVAALEGGLLRLVGQVPEVDRLADGKTRYGGVQATVIPALFALFGDEKHDRCNGVGGERFTRFSRAPGQLDHYALRLYAGFDDAPGAAPSPPGDKDEKRTAEGEQEADEEGEIVFEGHFSECLRAKD